MKSLLTAIADVWQFYRKHGIWGSLRSKEAPWLLQFGKYGICGVMATVLHQGLFFILAKWVIPALDGQGLTDLQRANHGVIDNCIAFVFSNTFVYFVNLLIVFESGRHSKVREFLYFTMVNFLAMLPALAIAWWAAKNGNSTPNAQLLFIITAVMVNFLARKFFVFKK